jgi:glycosyltransferase involved in cell wall biosynthesis
MKVVVVSGIWPPDIGGPASHAPEVARYLHEHGHAVRAVVTAERAPAPEAYPVEWIRRSLPKPALHAAAVSHIAAAARIADVVYATGMFTRTALACAAARRPFVLKLTGDPAFERARWRHRVAGDVESFQHGGGGAEAAALRLARNLTVRSAAHVLCPSEYLRRLALGWGVKAERISVLPNAIAPPAALPSRDELRASFGLDGPTLAFAGRFGPQKALDVLVAAVERAGGVTLVAAGVGEPPPLGTHGRLLGPLERSRVLELFAAVDAVALSSAWENFPHALVEALSVGTPVIATRVGGVPEIVEDGVNGLLVPAGDPAALAAAIRRFFADGELRGRLRAAAAASVERFRPDRVYPELEALLERAAR